jgi:transposase
VGAGGVALHARLRGRGAWLAQQMAKTPIAGLLRIARDTVGRIVERVIADHLDERRLAGLVAIGVDEIAYRRHHRYLTSVVDHRTGVIVWRAAGRNAATLRRCFDELGDRKTSIRAVSIDMSGGYVKAIRDNLPGAEIAFGPFHVVRLGQRAVDQVRRDERNAHERSHTPIGRWVKGTRCRCSRRPTSSRSRSLRCSAKSRRPTRRSTAPSRSKRNSGCSTSSTIRRSRPRFDAWRAWAARSRLRPFVRLARTIRGRRKR